MQHARRSLSPPHHLTLRCHFLQPLSETHLTEKDVKEAAKAAVELDSTPDKGLLEVLVRMYASAM